MPTARLTVSDKNGIVSYLTNIIDRVTYSQPFPFKYSRDPVPPIFYDMAVKSCNAEEQAAYELLFNNCRTAIRRADYVNLMVDDLEQIDEEGRFTRHAFCYRIDSTKQPVLPRTQYILPIDHRAHGPIVRWGREQAIVRENVLDANIYLEDIVNNSTTVGQIKRALPLIVPYLPNRLQRTFEQAERRSRFPMNVSPSKESEQNVYRMLGLGSMLEPPTHEQRYDNVEYTGATKHEVNRHYFNEAK